MTPRLPDARLVVVSLLSTAIFLGLAVWGWGDSRSFLGHPARLGLCLGTAIMVVATLFSGCSVLSPGRREDVANRWIFGPVLVISVALSSLPPYTDRRDLWSLDGDAVRYLGLVLFLIGGTLRVATIFALGRQFSGLVAIQEGHRLVTTGLYRWLRHPSYLGALLTVAGWALVFRSEIGLLLTLLLVPILINRMDAEEALLQSEFGAAYESYKRHTWRLIPFVY